MVNIQFKRKIYSTGTSTVVTLPEEVRNFLGLNDGDEVILQPETGKKGKYISLWKAG